MAPGDAGGSGDGSGDAAKDGPAASGVPRFTAPTLVAALSGPDWHDSDPTFTGDLLELYFTSDRGGGLDLWVSRRATTDAPWNAPTLASDLSTSSSEYGAAVSLDGLRIWFTTDRDGSTGRIWKAFRLSRSAPWGPAAAVAEVPNTSGSSGKDLAPTIDAAETTMMFGSSRIGSQAYDIYYSTRAGFAVPWATPIVVPGINGPADEWDPFVTQGGLVVFLTSTRAGSGDIYWAARQSTAEAFPPPQPVTDLNSTSYDSGITLSADLTYAMFDSFRAGSSDIYEARAAF